MALMVVSELMETGPEYSVEAGVGVDPSSV
jgi:hypothetical protein